jgi:hypothetical protein
MTWFGARPEIVWLDAVDATASQVVELATPLLLG